VALQAAHAGQVAQEPVVLGGDGGADAAAAGAGLDLGRGPVGDHPAADQDHDPVGVLVGLLQVVGGEQDGGPAVGQPAHAPPERPAGLHVHAGGGLVQEEQL
jgi:hypothetical protein